MEAKEGEEGLERKVHALSTTDKPRGDKRLRKITWNFPSNRSRVLIQVVGDIRVAEEDALKSRAPRRRRPIASVIREAEASKETASPLMERMVREAGNSQMEQLLFSPASKSRVRSWQSRHRGRQGQKDVWANLFTISREFNMIHLLMASPRILVLQTELAMLELVKEVLAVPFAKGGGKQCMGIDTQFKVQSPYTSFSSYSFSFSSSF